MRQARRLVACDPKCASELDDVLSSTTSGPGVGFSCAYGDVHHSGSRGIAGTLTGLPNPHTLATTFPLRAVPRHYEGRLIWIQPSTKPWDVLHRTGPDLVGGNSNHGPMVAEVLLTLGRPGSVMPWIEGYKNRFQERSHPDTPMSPESWHEALGDRGRSADWVAFFDQELLEGPWQSVLRTWVPRLAPGSWPPPRTA